MAGINVRTLFLFIVLVGHWETLLACNGNCSVCTEGTCTECYYNYWGPSCQRRCVNCWHGGCEKNIGICKQCKPGRYTDDCGVPCPHNCRPTGGVKNCNRTSGQCLEGCNTGWWGPKCDKRCSQGCGGDHCYQHNGGCMSDCKKGWSGRKCSHHNCLTGQPHNGECQNDCKLGWWGKACSDKCGEQCVSCDQYSDRCTTCKKGLYGSQCQSECSLTCVSYECDMNGVCMEGCNPGFRGNKCSETCPFNCLHCEQYSDSCSKCKIGFTGSDCHKETVAQQYRNANNKPKENGASSIASKSENVGFTGLMILLRTASVVPFVYN